MRAPPSSQLYGESMRSRKAQNVVVGAARGRDLGAVRGVEVLPEGKGEFDDRVVEHRILAEERVRVGVLRRLVLHRLLHGRAAHEHLRLEREERGAAARVADLLEEGDVARVGRAVALGRGVRDRGVDVAREEAPVVHARHAALADAGRDPLAGEEGAERVDDGVVIGGRLLDGELRPVCRRWAGGAEEAVLDEDLVGVEHLGRLVVLLVGRVDVVARAGEDDGRLARSVEQGEPLLEVDAGRVQVILRLIEAHHEVAEARLVGGALLHGQAGDPLELREDVGGRRAAGAGRVRAPGAAAARRLGDRKRRDQTEKHAPARHDTRRITPSRARAGLQSCEMIRGIRGERRCLGTSCSAHLAQHIRLTCFPQGVLNEKSPGGSDGGFMARMYSARRFLGSST